MSWTAIASRSLSAMAAVRRACSPAWNDIKMPRGPGWFTVASRQVIMDRSVLANPGSPRSAQNRVRDCRNTRVTEVCGSSAIARAVANPVPQARGKGVRQLIRAAADEVVLPRGEQVAQIAQGPE